MAQTRSITRSCSSSGISSGALLTLTLPSTLVDNTGGAARGPRSGPEILTGVLEATVRDPSGRGPSARLMHGLESPVTGRRRRATRPHFHAREASPTGIGRLMTIRPRPGADSTPSAFSALRGKGLRTTSETEPPTRRPRTAVPRGGYFPGGPVSTRTYWHLDVPEELAQVLRRDEDGLDEQVCSVPASAGGGAGPGTGSRGSSGSSSRRASASSSGTSRCQYVRVVSPLTGQS